MGTAGLTLGRLEAAAGDPPFHDRIPLIAGPSSYLLTRRRHLQLPAKNIHAAEEGNNKDQGWVER